MLDVFMLYKCVSFTASALLKSNELPLSNNNSTSINKTRPKISFSPAPSKTSLSLSLSKAECVLAEYSGSHTVHQTSPL